LGASAHPRKSAFRLAAAGAAVALLVWGAGRRFEQARFGLSDVESVARIEDELRQRFDRAAETLGTIAQRVAEDRSLISTASRDDGSVGRLFDSLAAVLPEERTRTTGITVYRSPGVVALAWAGRVSVPPRERIDGPAALFVAPRGRLIRTQPVVDKERPVRLGTIVVEQMLGDGGVARSDDSFVVSTPIAPVLLRPSLAHIATESPFTFLIPGPSGQALMEGEVKAEDLVAAHERWRAGTRSVLWSVFGVTLLLCCGVLLDVRRRACDPGRLVASTAGGVALLVAAWGAFSAATSAISSSDSLQLLLTALLLAAIVWLLLDLVERRRVSGRRSRLVPDTPRTTALTSLLYVATGAAGTSILLAYEGFIRRVVTQATLDLTHFSLHPLSRTRLELAFGLVLLHVAVLWSVVLVLRFAAVEWRRPRSAPLFVPMVLSWLAGSAAAVVVARQFEAPVRLMPLVAAVLAAAALAFLLQRPRGRARRGSETARLFAMYLALLMPALVLYPSLYSFAIEAKERLIAEEFGPQAQSQREDLWRRRLPEALGQIDAMSSTLVDFVTTSAEDETPTRDRAYLAWSQTALAQYRLTSSIELYTARGRLVSGFALNLPEYAPTPYVAGPCEGWDSYEIPPLGSTERHVLRASRSICESGRAVGGVVVRVMFDYRDLPFVSAQRRYLDSLGPGRRTIGEDELAADIAYTVYGWSQAPLYTSGTSVWPLPDEVFARMVKSREPFWETVDRDGQRFRVYYLNDRGGIYALGYPSVTWFGHLINLAELVTLTFALYILLLAASTAFNALFSTGPVSGRSLMSELRSSFYRKLFLFFVLASVVPVGILALATRAYFSAQLQAGVEEDAVNTATVAQRLVEDYAALQKDGAQTLGLLDDQVMVLVSRAIDQDVDLFDGPRLQATSERDLFASGVLSERTPSEVFRRIAIERRPTFVGVEEIAGQQYQLAAAPVRALCRECIVTVPQTLRQQEIERQIDDLNQQVVLGLVLFVLLGAFIGYSMAERIADPVSRLTRATRRIARGDLDARIAATSSDELRRLVEDFNHMAADLKRQRIELERTQRLEAWADMARQVAHDIKNPLTPIQLSAEHARRVNQDRGRPLSPALDECITSILTQVKLLRQIAAEFSSFASSPTAHPETIELPSLIDEVVEPYRPGLPDRVTVDVRSAPNLPAVRIDRTLFARALTNVIENALHAMPGGGRLTIDSRPGNGEERSVAVQISDSGVGMDPEAAAKIFEPYFSTKASGTGLGLTIAKRNVELIGGTIVVQSERGVGTTVTMTLPVATRRDGGPSHPAAES
jgi:signal transduction histidine kinase